MVEETKAPAIVASKIVGIIYPPPELRNIIDKTAQFVARNGIDFEEKVRNNEASNPKFSFLSPGDPYHVYYQTRVRDGGQALPPRELSKAVTETSNQPKVAENITPLEPPPEFEFTVTVPTISAQDIALVKLTAQFVARNGQSFLKEVMQREARNYRFDFLKPQHSLFNFMTKLVEQYTKVMVPPKGVKERLLTDAASKSVVLKRIYNRVAWAKLEQQRKKKAQDEAEKERVAYMQIDWHDFVIVETVPFAEDEDTDLPPTVDPKTLAVRVLEQERFEAKRQLGIEEESEEEEDEEEEREGEGENAAVVSEPEEVEEVDMDVDMDVESPPGQPAPPEAEPFVPPMPPEPSTVIVREYDPKKTRKTGGQVQYQVCPLCHQNIPVQDIQEHIRIELLDPSWREQRERAERERAAGGEAFVGGTAMEEALKMMAPYRTDIFGEIDTGRIGVKAGEEGKARDQKITWDGHTSSMSATAKAAQAAVTQEEKWAALQAAAGLGPSPADNIGPRAKPITGNLLPQSAPGTGAQSSDRPLITNPLPVRNPLPGHMGVAMHQMPMGMAPFGMPFMAMPGMMQMRPPGMPVNMLAMNPPQPPRPPTQPLAEDQTEPAAKKPKTDIDNIHPSRRAAMGQSQ